MPINPKALKTLLASLAGTTALAPEESEAAGLQTLARRLGVSLDEAKRLKALAQDIKNPDMERLRAVQTVRESVQDPDLYPRLGGGADASVYDVGEDVLKKFHTRADLQNPINPAVLELSDMGPKTQTIRTPSREYQLQKKLGTVESPMQSLIKTPGLKEEFDRLGRKQAKFDYNPDVPEVQALEKQRMQMAKDAFIKRHGVTPEELAEEYKRLSPRDKKIASEEASISSIEDVLENPSTYLEAKAHIEAKKAGKGVLDPYDTHEGNIGLTPEKKLQIFDTSRFGDPDVSRMTPEMKEHVLKRDISSPEKRKALEELLYSQDDSMKKAAAFAPIGAMDAGSEDESYLDKAKDLGMSALEHLSRPGAALRGLTYAAQRGEPILDAAKQGFLEPSQAPTGVDIAEATNLPDDAVGLKTAISTAAEFADPIDILGLGAASKFGKLRKVLK